MFLRVTFWAWTTSCFRPFHLNEQPKDRTTWASKRASEHKASLWNQNALESTQVGGKNCIISSAKMKLFFISQILTIIIWYLECEERDVYRERKNPINISTSGRAWKMLASILFIGNKRIHLRFLTLSAIHTSRETNKYKQTIFYGALLALHEL